MSAHGSASLWLRAVLGAAFPSNCLLNARWVLSMNASAATAVDWPSFQSALQQMSSAGNVEIHEAGEWLAELAAFRWEISHQGKFPLLHLWSDARNLTRRLLDIKEQSPDRIVLTVQRYGYAKPGRLEFVIPATPRVPLLVARERFRVGLHRILEANFPDADVEPLTTISDLRNSFSRVYVRGGMMEKNRL